MTSTLHEVLDRRRDAAAREARRAATKLARGDARDVTAQIALDERLDDLLYVERQRRELDEIADVLAPYSDRAGRADIIQDMNRARGGDQTAELRLDAHRRSTPGIEWVGIEARDLGGTLVAAQVPGWMTTNPAPTTINATPLITFAQPLKLQSGNTIDLVGFDTPPTASAQSSPNAAISTVDYTDNTASLPIRTYASSVLVSTQAIEQGAKGIDAQVLPRMTQAVDAAIDADVLNGSGSSGTIPGLINTANVQTQAYTDSTPTAAEFIAGLETLVRKVVNGGQGGAPVVIMHPRRLSFLREKIATASAPVAVTFSDATIAAATVRVNGLNIITDSGVPTTLSTNTDAVIVLRDVSALGDFYVSPPVVDLAQDTTASNTIKSRITVRRYAAFSTRLPGGVGILTGSGLSTP